MPRNFGLAAGNSPDNEEGLLPGCNCVGQREVRRLVRQVFLASKEPQERSPLLRAMLADGATQHRITGLKRVENRAQRDRTFDFELDFTSDMRQRAKVLRQFDSNHCMYSMRRRRLLPPPHLPRRPRLFHGSLLK